MAAFSKKIENISAALGRLSRREKFMVGGLAAVFVLFVGTLVSLWISSSLGSLEKGISHKTGKLQMIIDLREQYEEAKRALKASEQRIVQARNIQVMGTLENVARQLGINTQDLKMNPRSSTANAETDIEEKKVEVTIQKITLDRLVDFLEQVEAKSESIKIRTLHIKKFFRDRTLLVAEFTVSKFEKKAMKEEKTEGASASKPSKKT